MTARDCAEVHEPVQLDQADLGELSAPDGVSVMGGQIPDVSHSCSVLDTTDSAATCVTAHRRRQVGAWWFRGAGVWLGS